jgi:hypothetical protein
MASLYLLTHECYSETVLFGHLNVILYDTLLNSFKAKLQFCTFSIKRELASVYIVYSLMCVMSRMDAF